MLDQVFPWKWIPCHKPTNENSFASKAINLSTYIQDTGTQERTIDQPRSGRPRAKRSTQSVFGHGRLLVFGHGLPQDRYIRVNKDTRVYYRFTIFGATHLRDRFQNSSHTVRTIAGHQPVSIQTVIHRLLGHGNFGIGTRRPLQRTELCLHHKQARLLLANITTTYCGRDNNGLRPFAQMSRSLSLIVMVAKVPPYPK
ncbi:hypothetical protein PoB_007203800 [Plakobranchus ocellatus]|uniref:Uncharacterized protein n=1 Tax=Plakobranchus ocellatus TaxID=259542 RepID=A0AAV4DN86_9GAST|nr:hypothetical protein PoB_007203800 [Plakobranchus ocellatus]